MTIKKSILFLSTAANWPLTDGKRQRTWFLLEGLSKVYNIDFLFIGFQQEKALIEKHTTNYRKLFFIELNDSISLRPYFPKILLTAGQKKKQKEFKERVKELFELISLSDYELVFSRYLNALSVLPISLSKKIVCDIDDIFFETYKTRVKNESNYITKAKICFHHFVSLSSNKILLNKIDVPIVVKESDKKYFGLKNAICLPNLPFGYFLNNHSENIQNIKPVENKKITFGFIGKLSYRPNYKGLVDFIHNVWNPLIKRGSKETFVIAGSGEMHPELKRAISDSSNILFLGFVENAKEFWNKIDVLVVPINEGGGTNIKIAEAFMYGKKVIASSFSSRGFEPFKKDEYLIVSTNNQEWAKEIIQMSKPQTEFSHEIHEKAKQEFDINTWNSILINNTK